MKKICVISGSSSEYGLLYNVLKKIKRSKSLRLFLIVTGSHLSKSYGNTIREIISDGFKITKKINVLKKNRKVDFSNSTAIGIVNFSKAFKKINPDLIVIVGDRYEIFSASIAASFCKVPIAHFHGGELTRGAMDEFMRHSITKMSHIHLVSNEIYRKRVIQLGENPRFVHNIGGLGVDNIKKMNFLSKKDLERKINFKLDRRIIITTFHPVTLKHKSEIKIFEEILKAYNDFKNCKIIFTGPNADVDNIKIFNLIKNFTQKNKKNSIHIKSLGRKGYLSLLKYADVMVGNSSSGLLEFPSFKKPTINLGSRQDGRIKSKSVIQCKPFKDDIVKAIKLSFSNAFFKKISKSKNPYGEGGASEKALKIFKSFNNKNIIAKKFYDLKV